MKTAGHFAVASLILALAATQSAAQVPAADRSSVASAPPPVSRPSPVERTVHPGWAELPSADQMTQFFPPVAQLIQVTGRVRLRCHVTPADTLDQCRVVSEIPKGLGFADAGLLLVPYFHLNPRPAADRTDSDFTIVPIRFALPQPDPVPPEIAGRKPSLRSVLLARRLVAVVAGNADDATAETMRETRDRLAGEVSDTILATPETEKALAALEASFRGAFPAFKEELAQSFARVYTEQDLARIVAFMESPVGRRWQSHNKEANQVRAAAWQRIWQGAQAQASVRLCKEIQCDSGPPAAPAAQ